MTCNSPIRMEIEVGTQAMVIFSNRPTAVVILQVTRDAVILDDLETGDVRHLTRPDILKLCMRGGLMPLGFTDIGNLPAQPKRPIRK